MAPVASWSRQDVDVYIMAPDDAAIVAHELRFPEHLQVLRDSRERHAERLRERREGRQRIYQLHPKPLREVVSWAQEFEAYFNQRLDALEAHLDRKRGRKKR